ncbi:HsdM family class I SAM-dependent methyltransferase [Streptococcus ruminantium]|uniref:site-specific DNA-methyltransferase (adenine-specific) n=1 Tax=Streptococcus ruminantium TaxID=1917441 RepID=A0ABU1B2U2_9STRE|nr:N-6 DNA methylase [Streptococcus ruminantium]MDQ8759890.1 N-6 DNA methylase [Streptococcus ruminantium]MDQ8765091.1 N-6 DNA methylase [Streptococcus ruminantium]MDQ8768972.1 N-6 DNA methylase [Streptococcus ruminantium]MDQ8774299.1 N-6 DNA methylase [Streptococcus ruminantium]MDQ8793209.1 N-6 DNA methylase [Streptococcus ruminantium]
MAKKEVNTDLWVHELLKEAGIRDKFDAQGSSIKEINDALKSASKKGTGNSGFPEYVGVVKDFLIIIEDKPGLSKHINYTDDDLIADDVKSNTDYAVNGAVFYAKHLSDKVSYKKIIALGISGNEKKHRITPVFINERGEYTELADIETLISFSLENIDEYYVREILQEETNFEKETAEILKDAATLHNDLRNYGNIEEKNKPLIVSGILLALRETEHGNFSLESLTGDTVKTDGSKIYAAIKSNLQRANVSPEVKKDKLLSQFAIIRDDVKINEVNTSLGKTPIKHFTEFLYKSIYQSLRYNSSAEDYLGRFYGEFMSYSGGDGQNLGIVLTPKHITELFCDLVNLKPTDKVFDPTCGTAGFLIAAMHDMLVKAENDYQREQIRKHQLFGIEEQSYMFTIATTNMILRGDGKSNLENQDFLRQNPSKLQLKQCNVGMMNPPYSMGSKANPELYEINFTEHLLNSLVEGAKAVVIVPQSTFTGKTKNEKEIKQNILKHHTLEGVITLNKNTFYGVGTNPCIAVFTAGIPHRPDKECKFINFENDGFEVSKHIGLVETASAKDKKQHLLDVWFDRTEAETRFCVQTTIEHSDEWLHSFYYFNDEIPSEADFQKTIADYLTFEVNMITHGRGYLFGIEEEELSYPEAEEEEIQLVAEGEADYE